jgi:hypothetical protein
VWTPARGIDHFWTAPASLDDLRISIERPGVDAAPIKRLGSPGFWGGRGDLIALFSNLYRMVTEEARTDAVARDGEKGDD